MIEMKGIHDIYQNRSVSTVNKASKMPEEKPASLAASGEQDVIQISSEATLKLQLDAETKVCVQKMKEELSAERLEALKEKYAGESCPISGTETAKALINRMHSAQTKEK